MPATSAVCAVPASRETRRQVPGYFSSASLISAGGAAVRNVWSKCCSISAAGKGACGAADSSQPSCLPTANLGSAQVSDGPPCPADASAEVARGGVAGLVPVGGPDAVLPCVPPHAAVAATAT